MVNKTIIATSPLYALTPIHTQFFCQQSDESELNSDDKVPTLEQEPTTPNDANVHVDPVKHLPDYTMDEPTDEKSSTSQDMAQDEILALTEERSQSDQTPQPEEESSPIAPNHLVLDRPNRRSNRIPQCNARYNEYRRSLGIHSEQLDLLDEFRAKHASAQFTEVN